MLASTVNFKNILIARLHDGDNSDSPIPLFTSLRNINLKIPNVIEIGLIP
jgi:hypothetical protein